MHLSDQQEAGLAPLHPARPRLGGGLPEFVAGLSRNRTGDWASRNYKETIQGLIDLLGAKTVLEIGGGRWPLLNKEEISAANITYLVNDISADELRLAPDYVEKVCFNIAQPSIRDHEALRGKVDLMFSYNVFEHVADVHQAYRNIYEFLAPGGVCLNFHPVLYSPPFVVNWLLPESMSSRLLRVFFPHRNAREVPKHPARYDHCSINGRERDAMLALGFSGVWQIPFWYHDYFRKIPGLYQADLAFARLADRNNWTTFASYCFTLVTK